MTHVGPWFNSHYGLTEILDASRTAYERHGITRVLFFDKGYLSQILDGRNASLSCISRSF